MGRTAPLLLALVAAGGVLAYFALHRPAPPPSPPQINAKGKSVEEWTGSPACASCHAEITERWSKSAHALGFQPFSPETTMKPFDGDRFVTRDIEHRMGPGPFMECEGPGGTKATFPVEMVIGVRRVQMFTTSMDKGKIQVLPVFLEVPRSKWFDYADFIFGGPTSFDIPPDSPDSWYTFARNFNSRCGGCHLTRYETGYDADAGAYDSRWVEPGVGCEACHGPGGAHVRHWREKLEGRDPIVHPAKLPLERQQQICGQCHSESEVVAPGYRPGDDLFSFVDVAGLEDERHAYPDGRAKELLHNLVPILESSCGPLACTTCHDPHGRGIPGDLYRPLGDNWICLQCHAEMGERIEAHTHHSRDSEGSRCIACHMPRMVIEGGHGRVYDHTISIPSPRATERIGVPNSCIDCHMTEVAGWEMESFEKWYPGAEDRNHRGPLAQAVNAARRRDPQAPELLKPFLGDPKAVYRAAAARLLLRSDVDLRPQLSDPSPLVRRAAIDGVAARHPEALEPLLEDPNMVLRYAAAMALAQRAERVPFDWIAARPALRDRVLSVLEGFERMRNDRDVLHFTLARLYEGAGRIPEAIRAYECYFRLWAWDEQTKKHVEQLRAREAGR